MLHPDQPPRQSHIEQALADEQGPVIAASDYVRAVPEQLSPLIDGGVFALGTDGMGRSETRAALRRHFEVDAECITLATLYRLHQLTRVGAWVVARAVQDLGVDPEKVDPLFA